MSDLDLFRVNLIANEHGNYNGILELLTIAPYSKLIVIDNEKETFEFNYNMDG